jgi:hypothetical protein
MSDIFDFLTKINPEDTNADLSLEKIIKKWENDVLSGLGANKENWSYSMESDMDFANAQQDNISSDQLLKSLFNSDLPNSTLKAQFINEKTAEFVTESEKTSSTRSRYSLSIHRSCDTIGKLSLRFKLKPWIDAEHIPQLLNLLKDTTIKIEMGGTPIFTIPKLMLVYLICETLGSGIKYFDVNKFLETYEVDEIKKLIINWENDLGSNFSNRYYFTDPVGKYLDIPILNDFFSYKLPIPLIAMQFHDVRVRIDIPSTVVNEFTNSVETIGVISDDNTYFSMENRRELAQHKYNLLIMNSSINYFHSYTSPVVKILTSTHLKFLFIFIRPTDEFFTDANVCLTDLPELSSVDIKLSNSSYAIDMGKVYRATYDNIICYGIAVDGYSDMTNWISVTNECVELLDLLKNKESKEFENFNPETADKVYKIVKNPEQIIIKLTSYSIPVSIEIYEINQNLQRIMSGMTGPAFIN